MKNLRNFLTATILMAVLMIGTSTAKAGILMTDFTGGSTPCTEIKDDSTKVNSGILVTFTGILVTLTGILVTVADDTQEDCAVIIND